MISAPHWWRALALVGILSGCRTSAPARPVPPPLQADVTPEAIRGVMTRIADWQLANPSADRPWRWTNAAFYAGLAALAELDAEGKYQAALKEIGEREGFRPGPRPYHGDDHAVLQAYLRLHRMEADPKILPPALALFDHLAARRFDEPLLWQNEIQNREWAWCDVLFMSPPALTAASALTGDPKYRDLMHRLWWKTTDYLYDPAERLYYRDSRFFDRREPNGQKVFWSRGNGWVIAGLVRVLEEVPTGWSERPRYEALFREMAARIVDLQLPDGYWRASLLDPKSTPNPESSGTGFFTYALAWGVNHGMLDRERYLPAVRRGWQALVRAVGPDGKLGWVQPVGFAPGQTEPDRSEPYGVGAMLLAGSEIYKLAALEGSRGVTVDVQNPLDEARADETVEIAWSALASLGEAADRIVVHDARTGSLLPAQRFEDRLLWKASLDAGERRRFSVRALARPLPVVARALARGRFVPERKDDFAWENDRIAFRMYGPALQAAGEISSGIDVWAKRVRRPVIDAWYERNDYHKDHGEGLDFYKVGASRGCGGLGLMAGDALVVSRNYSRWRPIADGPLRAAFELEYEPWGPAGATRSETKRISLDVGHSLSRIESRFGATREPLPVAVGIQKRGKGTVLRAAAGRWVGYWEPPQGDDGQIGCGVVHAWADAKTTEGDDHLLIVAPAESPIVYWVGAAWSKGLDFSEPQRWADHLAAFSRRIAAPLVVSRP